METTALQSKKAALYIAGASDDDIKRCYNTDNPINFKKPQPQTGSRLGEDVDFNYDWRGSLG